MHNWKTKQIYPNVYQIEDYRGVNVILINGENKSILWDMGYGVYDLVSEIKKITSNEVMVFASHGHLDHTLGCTQFSEIYVNKKDHALFYKQNGWNIRKKVTDSLRRHNIFNRFDAFKYIIRKLPKIKDLPVGSTYDLGGISATIVDLKGHTAGSVGLLLNEYRLLLTGDAVCNDLWIYLDESLGAKTCIDTLNYCLELPFDFYVCAHQDTIYPKRHICNIINVLDNLDPDTSNTRVLFRTTEVYESTEETEFGTVSILYNEDKL